MIKTKISAILLAALTACAIPTAVQANYQQENKIIAESLNNDSAELVTESLSNYSLGYMSWGVKHMGLDKLQKKFENSGKKLPEVRVAVMDTGIKKSNRYLQGRYLNEGYNFIDNNTNFDDDQYHGTEVSGIIADGTSSNVKILPIKVMDEKGDGKMSDTAKGIYYALEHGADVINLSLSGNDKNNTYHSLDDAIAEAISRNVIVIAAAGNEDTDASFRYPANKENVITITSVNKNNTLGLLANYGSVIDFALPGMNILAPHKSIMLLDSGTSMAAPHAAAAAALLKTWDKAINQDEVMQIFKEYAIDLGEKGFDNTYGWGMINLARFDINRKPLPHFVRGDANGDGVVNITDVTCIQQMLAELEPEQYDEKAADYDGDGVVTIHDATAIQYMIADMEE